MFCESILVPRTRAHRALVERAHSATLLAFSLLVALVAGCAKDPIRPYPGEPTPPMVPDIDVSPEWSHDGHWIAYRRRFLSTDGPPGLYIIQAAGGRSRFLAAGDFFQPSYLRFSPDDRRLACVLNRQLLLVDFATGMATQPMYTEHGVAEPDWSPDGSQIAYRRLIYQSGD